MAGPDDKLTMDLSLLRAGERVCVAVSGGADSVALLVGLQEVNARQGSLGLALSAVHVHHGLRGDEADGDEEFVRALCERLTVPLQVFRVDTSARQVEEREGLEEAARTLRYEAFQALDADAVVTAHTLDDQAETVVMKMLRGAWTEGIGGISPELHKGQGPRIVRPLLGTRRSEIEAFLTSRGQAWRTDSSNADLSLTRNRVRHELMPVLRGFNPGVEALLGRTSEIARDEEDFWREEVERTLRAVLLPGKPVRGGGRAATVEGASAGYAMELERLKAMPSALRRRVLREAVKRLGVRMSSEEVAKALALGGFGGFAGVTGKIGSRLELGNGLRVERSARELQFRVESPKRGSSG